jgi:predicted GNAT family N-acyltransferase
VKPSGDDAKIRITPTRMDWSTIYLKEITKTHWVPRTFALRFEVWNAETTLRPEVREHLIIADEHDEHARHWAAFAGDEMVAAARMCVHDVQEESPDAPAFSRIRLPAPIATINRLVVVPLARKCGLAKQFDECRINAAKCDGAKCVVGTAAPARIDALKRLGFCVTGEEWIQPYCELLTMQGMALVF